MKSKLTLRAVLLGPMLLLPLGLLHGQEAQNPDNTGAQAVRAEQATAPLPAATPTIPPLGGPSPTIVPVEPASIIPPNTLPGPDLGSVPQIPAAPELQKLNELFKRSSLGQAADEHRLHVQTAALETQIRNDQDLHELKRLADAAPTDLERRHRFRNYYEAYYRKLRARADSPELIAYLKVQEAAHEATLLQPRVRHETDEAKAGPSATPLPTPVQAKVTDVFNH